MSQSQRPMRPWGNRLALGDRLITKLPLEELWSATADFPDARCLGAMEHDDLARLLKEGPVWFVIADCGHRPAWTDLKACYDLWRQEVMPHLVRGESFSLDDYPHGYAYVAKLWDAALANPVVVLEKHH